MKLTWLTLTILTFSLTGCGGAHWVKNTDTLVEHSDGYAINIDPNWVQYKNTAIYNDLYFTKDGPSVNYINIETISDQKLQMKVGKLPADILFEDWISTYLSYRFKETSYEKIADGPTTIGKNKHPGFFTDVRIPGEKSLPTRIKSYAFRDRDSLFVLEYSAPELFYFERDLHIFENVTATLSR